MYKNQVVEQTVILDKALGIYMVDIVRAVGQMAQFNVLPGICAFPELKVIEKQPFVLKPVISHCAHCLKLLGQAARVLRSDIFV